MRVTVVKSRLDRLSWRRLYWRAWAGKGPWHLVGTNVLNRGIKLAFNALLVLSALMAFSVVHRLDDYRVIGPKYELFVSQKQNASSGEMVVTMLTDFSRAHRVNLGFTFPDMHRPDTVRHFYLSVGDRHAESTSWLVSGYPAFNSSLITHVHPMASAVKLDAGGFYQVFGDRAVSELLREEFDRLGYSSTIRPFMSVSLAYAWFGYGALQWCLLAAVLITAAGAALGVLFSSKSYAIQQLEGRSFSRQLRFDLVRLMRHLMVVIPILTSIGLVVLYLYNGLRQLTTFLVVAVGFAVLLAVVALVTHVITLFFLRRLRPLKMIKGELPAAWIIVSAYALRTVAIVLAFLVAVETVGIWQRIEALQLSRPQWSSAGAAVRILLNGTLGERLDSHMATVGAWLREQDRRGKIIIAVRRQLREFPPPEGNASFGEVLEVNRAYLERQRVRLASGGFAKDLPAKGVVHVLVPPAYKERITDIHSGVSSWVTALAGMNRSPAPQVAVSELADGQRLFTYGSGSVFINDPSIKDGVVVVLDQDSKFLPDTEYAAYATSASVVFLNPSDVESSRSDSRLAVMIRGIEPIARRADGEHGKLLVDFRYQVINSAIVLVVLLITAVGICVAFCRRHRQRIFAQYICGWPFWRTYRRIIGAEMALAVLVTGWAVWDTWTALGRKQAGVSVSTPFEVSDSIGRVAGWEPLLIFGIVAISFVFVLGMLVIYNRRVVRSSAADA